MFNIKGLGGVINMMNLISNFLEGIASLAAGFGTNACFAFFIDEPECPESLIK